MFSDGVVDLAEAGVDHEPAEATFIRGRIVTSFVLGSQRLYDFVHDNPFVEFHPCDRTNDTALHPRRTTRSSPSTRRSRSICPGRSCADSIGFRIYSRDRRADGLHPRRGAVEGGKPIIALPSTAAGGTVSPHRPGAQAGAGVVTTRGHVHWIATEYGAVNLFGLTLRQRAEALIRIAHPDARGDLVRAYRDTRHVDLGSGIFHTGAKNP